MRLRNSIHFLTFVLVLSTIFTSFSWQKVQAAPSKKIPHPSNAIKPAKEAQTNFNSPPLTLAHFSSSLWRFDLGYLQGVLRTDKIETNSIYFGLSRVEYKPNFTSYEWGGGLTADNILLLHLDYRTYFGAGSFYGAYYKTGIGAGFEANEGVANFINYQRYHLHGGIGFDDLWRSHNRYGADLGLRWGFNGLALVLQGSFAF